MACRERAIFFDTRRFLIYYICMEDQTMPTKKEQRELKRQRKEAEHDYQARAKKTKKYIARSFVAIIIALAVVGLWKLSQQPVDTPPSSDDILQIQSDDWIKGSASSTAILIEYIDFECEACGAYYPLVKRLSDEYEDKILFVNRYFPLSGHKNGLTAALAVEAAGRQGKYWEMHDLVFEEQRNWGERRSADSTIFERYAEQLNLDMEQFKTDVNSREVKDRVMRDKNAGIGIGVNATPTFFLNGKKIQNPRGYEAFKSLLDAAIEQ